MRFVYAGHLPHPYVFGLNQLPQSGDVLYITGGEKDVLSLASHGFHTICLNSETAKVPEDLLPSLQERFNHIAILYDMDDTGRKESANRLNELQELGCPSVLNIELPLCGSKQEKDVSDFFRLGHTANELSDLTEEAINNQNFRHRRR
jgi:DNA primase